MQQHYNNSLNIDIVILKSHLKIAIINNLSTILVTSVSIIHGR